MWKAKVDYLQFPHAGRAPSDEAVRKQTMRYIRADFDKNWLKYSGDDQIRIHALVVEHLHESQ